MVANQTPGLMDGLLPRALAGLLHWAAFSIMPTPTSSRKRKLRSDHFICVHDQTGKSGQIINTDLADTNNITRCPITTELAAMHPRQNPLIPQPHQRNLGVIFRQTPSDVARPIEVCSCHAATTSPWTLSSHLPPSKAQYDSIGSSLEDGNHWVQPTNCD